jgi:hypothetical protein
MNALSVNDAWNSVAPEERIRLLAQAQAFGLLAAILSFIFVGSVAYGFDQVALLLVGLAVSFLFFPLFANQYWRREKPKLILSYLAARSVARRYAYGYRFKELDIILIMRGSIERVFNNKEEEEIFKLNSRSMENSNYIEDVWICLLRGGIVILSERPGGAKLEFITKIEPSLVCKQDDKKESVTIQGIVHGEKQQIVLRSNSLGALYVFDRFCNRLVKEISTVKPKS